MGGRLWVEVAQEGLEHLEGDVLFGVLFGDEFPVGVVVGEVGLQPDEHFLRVGVDLDGEDVLAHFLVLDEGVLEHLLPRHPPVLVHQQAAGEEILGVFTDFGIEGEADRLVANAIQVFLHAPARPGRVPEYHFVKHQSQAPNIRFGSVGFVFEQLGGHVDGSAADVGQLLPAEDVCLACETEIPHFVVVVLDERVCRLDVAVDVSLADHHFEALHYFVEGGHALWLAELAGGQLFAEIGVAEFEDDEGVSVADLGFDHPDGVFGVDVNGDVDFSP